MEQPWIAQISCGFSKKDIRFMHVLLYVFLRLLYSFELVCDDEENLFCNNHHILLYYSGLVVPCGTNSLEEILVRIVSFYSSVLHGRNIW
jgi:hypothetical protein